VASLNPLVTSCRHPRFASSSANNRFKREEVQPGVPYLAPFTSSVHPPGLLVESTGGHPVVYHTRGLLRNHLKDRAQGTVELDTVDHCTEEQGTGLQDTEGGQVWMDSTVRGQQR
jgi:hypothetical protein